METKIKIKYGIGFILYLSSLMFAGFYDIKLFFILGLGFCGAFFLTEAYMTESKQNGK